MKYQIERKCCGKDWEAWEYSADDYPLAVAEMDRLSKFNASVSWRIIDTTAPDPAHNVILASFPVPKP